MRERFHGRGVRTAVAAAAVWAVCQTAAMAQVSLRTVVDLAQRESTTVRMATADVDKAQAVLAQSYSVYIPNLSIGSSLGYSQGFPVGQPSVGSVTMQSLFFSGSQRNYIQAAKSGLDAANLNLKDAKEQVALETSTAYIELDAVNRELDSARQQQQFADKLISIENERAEAGVDTALDLLEAKLTSANLKLARIHLESRASKLAKQLSVLTGMPLGTMTPDHASIPEIPSVSGEIKPRLLPSLYAADAATRSKYLQAHGDDLLWRRPSINFVAIYNYDVYSMGDYADYYKKQSLRPNNVTFGLQINFPFYDFALRAKAKQGAAEALRVKVEAEQAKRQNEVAISQLTGSLRELDALAEVASLKQQIAEQHLKSVITSLELGNGADANTVGAPAQLSPKAEQLARIDERQKASDALETDFDLQRARLNLLRALGHIEDWLNVLHTK